MREHGHLLLAAGPQQQQQWQRFGQRGAPGLDPGVEGGACFAGEQLTGVEPIEGRIDHRQGQPAALGVFDEQVGRRVLLAQRLAHDGRVVEGVQDALELQLASAGTGPFGNEERHVD